MSQTVSVGIAQLSASKSASHELMTASVAACIGLCVYDPAASVAGLAHILLPRSKGSRGPASAMAARFVDTGVPELIARMEAQGANRGAIRAALCGGADLLAFGPKKPALAVGARNIEAAREILGEMGIEIVAEDLGGSVARTVSIQVGTGCVCVKPVGEEPHELAVLG